MKAILVQDDQLQWTETEAPTMGPHQVRVRVRATALNRADLLQRRGRYPVPEGASEILGLEMAGEVIAVGDEVDAWQLGDRVCALLEGGGYAEEVVCDASMLLPIPEGRSFVDAAAMPEAYYTAYLNIWLEGEAKPGEHVIVHAAASGVGTAAIQLCRVLGHPVLGTASAAKLDQVKALGATAVVARGEDFVGPARALGDGHGADVILDLVGAAYLEQSLKALAPRGRVVVVGLVSGAQAPLNLGRLLMRRLTVKGSVLRSRSRAEKVEITRHIREVVWPRFADGSLHPVIDRTFPITEAEAAHAHLASNASVGKVVLEVP